MATIPCSRFRSPPPFTVVSSTIPSPFLFQLPSAFTRGVNSRCQRKAGAGVVRFAVPSNSQPGPEAEESDTAAFLPPEDLSFLAKLTAGSVGGAFVIKYGSVLFPDITRPNLLQALLMIATPVVLSVILLIKQSSSQNRS